MFLLWYQKVGSEDLLLVAQAAAGWGGRSTGKAGWIVLADQPPADGRAINNPTNRGGRGIVSRFSGRRDTEMPFLMASFVRPHAPPRSAAVLS